MMKMSRLKNNYADEKQSTLYTRFPSDHFLSNENNMYNALLWDTFFRRNLHRFAIDYLGIKLHLYQAIILYMMGISQFCVIIACRAAAKSFIIALYACCRCITRPYTKIVLSSAKKLYFFVIIYQLNTKRWHLLFTKDGQKIKKIYYCNYINQNH